MLQVLLDHPIHVQPKPEPRVWGGRRLSETLGRKLPEGPHGESWEIHGALTVSSGPWQGRTLDSLVAEFGHRLLGTRANSDERTFPLLTKWLDCRDWLSIQVHPDDALAKELSGDASQRGKSEAWYVAEVEPSAQLIHGLADGVTPEILNQTDGKALLKLLAFHTPSAGDLLYTGAGTVHALGPGTLIYEVQQSSDLTYRLYDWERDRPIHPVESKRCLTEAITPAARSENSRLLCPYFEIGLRSDPGEIVVDELSFTILAAVKGDWQLNGSFGTSSLAYGDTVLLPASLGKVQILGEGTVLEIRLGSEQPG